MTTMDIQAEVSLVSAEDLWLLSHSPEYADHRLELNEGVPVIISPAGGEHGLVTLRLGRKVGNFAEMHDLGVTLAAETGFILFRRPDGRDVVRAPDVAFSSKARIPAEGRRLHTLRTGLRDRSCFAA